MKAAVVRPRLLLFSRMYLLGSFDLLGLFDGLTERPKDRKLGPDACWRCWFQLSRIVEFPLNRRLPFP